MKTKQISKNKVKLFNSIDMKSINDFMENKTVIRIETVHTSTVDNNYIAVYYMK